MQMPQDPLAQLRDIHPPANIDFWPPAPGWWLLLGLILLVIGCGLFNFLRYRKQTAFKRAAIAKLAEINHSKNDQEFLQQLNQLLKQTALATHKRTDISRLSGQAWLQFLDQTPGDSFFSQGEGQALAQGPYQVQALSIDRQQFCAAVKNWIKRQPRQC